MNDKTPPKRGITSEDVREFMMARCRELREISDSYVTVAVEAKYSTNAVAPVCMFRGYSALITKHSEQVETAEEAVAFFQSLLGGTSAAEILRAKARALKDEAEGYERRACGLEAEQDS